MRNWFKRNGINGWGDFINLLTLFVLGFIALAMTCIMSSCSSSTDYVKHLEEENDRLKIELGQRDNIIQHYEEFRNTALDIYISEVDSTGDTYDGSDNGCRFWHESLTIDSLLATTIENQLSVNK